MPQVVFRGPLNETDLGDERRRATMLKRLERMASLAVDGDDFTVEHDAVHLRLFSGRLDLRIRQALTIVGVIGGTKRGTDEGDRGIQVATL